MKIDLQRTATTSFMQSLKSVVISESRTNPDGAEFISIHAKPSLCSSIKEGKSVYDQSSHHSDQHSTEDRSRDSVHTGFRWGVRADIVASIATDKVICLI